MKKEIQFYLFILLFIVTYFYASFTSVHFDIQRWLKNVPSDRNRFIEFWRQGGTEKIHQIGGNLGRGPFLTKKLLNQKLYDGKGLNASSNGGLFTDCWIIIKTEGLNIRYFFTQKLISTGLICIQKKCKRGFTVSWLLVRNNSIF